MVGKTKKKGWFKVCPEKWIFGSTREEMTPSERAVWMDFLALAYLNDPPGQVDFFTERRLANKLNITTRLLRSTIEKALCFGKIKLIGAPLGTKSNQKNKKSESTCNKSDAKSSKLVQSSSKSGIPQRSIIILKWNEYQSEYLRQKPYREKTSDQKEGGEAKNEQDAGLQNSGQESVTRVTDRGEERRKDKIKGEERREIEKNDSEDSNLSEVETSSSPPPSNTTPKEFSERERNSSSLREEGIPVAIWSRFSVMLKGCRGYPFDESQDYHFLGYLLDQYPDVDILAETDKKIAWWKQRPTALREFKEKTPRDQLEDWIRKEQDFQSRDSERPF